jgi:mycothiol system anti-sigma-R factor
MNCERCVESLHAFVDAELLPEEMEAVRNHLESCADCARAYGPIRDTSRLLKATLMRHPAPDVLKARIRASISAEGQGAPVAAVTRSRRWVPSWSRAAAAVLLAAVVGSGVTATVMRRGPATQAVADDVLASHIRSLLPGHLTDIASTNQHNVKPWFAGRVNLSPPVPRLDSLGFPLVGGRVDYVAGHSAAVVVYSRAQHVINVFWWAPGDGEPDQRRAGVTSDNGYHLIRGRRDGLQYWIVSDLNVGELEQFRRLLDPDGANSGN